MKILSNFDTNLYKRQVAHEKKEHGASSVLFVRRDIIYLIFKFYLPLVGIVLLWSGALWGIISIQGEGIASFVRGSLRVILGVSLVYFCRISVGKFIDHYMDYMIITPEQITAYDQEGLLHRSANTLDTLKIKSISIKQNGLLCSIFNYGSIVFFAEGDTAGSQSGQIQLNYIRSPRRCKQKIVKIISMGKIRERNMQSTTLAGQAERLKQSEVSNEVEHNSIEHVY